MRATRLTRFDFREAFTARRAGYLSEVEVDNMLMEWMECPSWHALILEIQQVREQLGEPRLPRPGEDG